MRNITRLIILALAGAIGAAFVAFDEFTHLRDFYISTGRSVPDDLPDPRIRYLLFVIGTGLAVAVSLVPLAFGRREWKLLSAPLAVVAWIALMFVFYAYEYQGFEGHVSINAVYRWTPLAAIAIGLLVYVASGESSSPASGPRA